MEGLHSRETFERHDAAPDAIALHRPSARRALPPLRVGLLNNMPDAALIQTERQFGRVVDAGAGRRGARLLPFFLDGVARGEQARAHMALAGYAPASAIPAAGLDALIVTGCEPKAAHLSDEPYFEAFGETVGRAWARGTPTLFSCLAAHAAVLHLDGIERRRLPAKYSGVYRCERVADHPLLMRVPRVTPVPHSRWNDLPEADLTAAGYMVLRRSAQVGVDLFLRERDGGLFVFLQGHPEYDGDSLAREYRRDVSRFLGRERADCPSLPAHYFPADAARRLSDFAGNAARMLAEGAPRAAPFPSIDVEPPLRAAWQAGAASLMRGFLTLVAERAAAAREAA